MLCTVFFFPFVFTALFLLSTENSGLLVTLLFLRTKESTKHSSDVSLASGTKQSLLLFIYRYVRLTPVYFVVIIINMVSLKWVEDLFSQCRVIRSVYPFIFQFIFFSFAFFLCSYFSHISRYTYNGSVFPPGLPDHIVCPNYWWRNILYIQTWFPFHQLCMLWSWYLANDMQFYIWAIVLLIFAKRYVQFNVSPFRLYLDIILYNNNNESTHRSNVFVFYKYCMYVDKNIYGI